MKKIIFAILILSMFIMIFSSCKTENSQSGTQEASLSEDVQNQTEINEQANDLTVSVDEEFVGDYQDNGEYYVVSYVGDAQMLNVPEKLDGIEIAGIDSGAFNSIHMVEVNIPSSIKEIEDKTFNNQINLKTVRLNEGLERIGTSAFINCGLLSDIELPSTLEIIGDSAFCGCYDLSEIVFPSGLKEIGLTAFGGTAIKTVTVPSGIQELPEWVFGDCLELTDVYIENPEIKIDSLAFENSPNVVLHAASGSTVEQFAAENGISFVAG